VKEKIRLRVFRGSDTNGYEKDYDVETFPGMVVLDAIHQIQAKHDSTVACRWNCKAAKCGSCSAEINGKPRLMCKSRVEDYYDDNGLITVHPLKTFPLIKDLVTDVSWNYKKAEQIPALSVAPSTPRPFRMQQIDVERIQEFRKCIECFLCQDVCHVLRDHNRKDAFFGPRHMVRIAALEMHPLDEEPDRRAQLRKEAGVGFCNITKCCTEVCPEHIHITDNAIIPLKERVADDYFDPVRGLIRLIAGPKKKKSKPIPTAPAVAKTEAGK
jgi:succinate dehydrogenase / fumarate reductase iron-sulfur subunit